MSVKIVIEDLGENDVLVVNNQVISDKGESPPAPPPPDTTPEYNHFGDFMDKTWGFSFTFTDEVNTQFFSNRSLDTGAGSKTIQFDMSEDVGGRWIQFNNGSNSGNLGDVEFRSGGKLIGSGTLQQTGSAGFSSDDIASDGVVKMKFLEGGSATHFQCQAYKS